jgi:hypothetical protein
MKAKKTDMHELINKAGSSTVVMVAISTVIVVFCLVSVKALLAQGAYQRRVVNAKHETVDKLKKNLASAKTLSDQYATFVSTSPNIIGGNGSVPNDATPPDGKNNRIVLDALPTDYDFPALISSLTKLLQLDSINNANVSGTDQSASLATGSASPATPITITQIPISGESSPAGVTKLLKDIERSVRPFDVTTLQLSFNGTSTTVGLTMNTYYQPAKKVTIGVKVVK